MSRDPAILVVEDEVHIYHFLSSLLSSSGYRPLYAATGREALVAVEQHVPQLMLLDLGLPDIDGMEVLTSLREWTSLPVIILSSRQSEEEKVAALDAGANDYVSKPFGNSELLARIRTALRLQAQVENAPTQIFQAGDLTVDASRRTVMLGGQAVHLTPNEYKIVLLLARNAGKVLTHEQIIQEVWGPYEGDSQLVRVHMANIRRKLEANPADPRYIQTEVGVGYRMQDTEGK